MSVCFHFCLLTPVWCCHCFNSGCTVSLCYRCSVNSASGKSLLTLSCFVLQGAKVFATMEVAQRPGTLAATHHPLPSLPRLLCLVFSVLRIKTSWVCLFVLLFSFTNEIQNFQRAEFCTPRTNFGICYNVKDSRLQTATCLCRKDQTGQNSVLMGWRFSQPTFFKHLKFLNNNK